MKRIKLIYTLLLAVALPLATACSNEDAISESETTQKSEKISIYLNIAQAESSTTRAAAETLETELINVWTVVAIYAPKTNEDQTNKDKVAAIYACKPSSAISNQPISNPQELPDEGTYRFYSFANMSPQKVLDLLGIQCSDTQQKEALANFMTDFPQGEIVKIDFEEETELTEDAVKGIAVQVNGNGFNPAADEDNGFGAKGIPMSNVQTYEDVTDGKKVDLIVIRMMAKIKLEIYNDKNENVKIESITLTNLTTNGEGNNPNLMLLPNLKDGQNTSDAIHADIQPNLYVNNGKTPAQVNFLVYKEDDETRMQEVSKTTNNSTDGTPIVYEFYVNESTTPDRSLMSPTPEDPKDGNNPNYNPDFYHFFLEIRLQGEEKARYVLIDDKGKTADDKWNYIARNDYRIIPIVLDDYKLDMIPYDFPAIGVYPASVKEEDGVYTINFHDYGHFHLQPVVTKYSKPTAYIEFTPTAPTDATYIKTTWGLVEDEFEKSWSSWKDASKQVAYENDKPNTYPEELAGKAFYRIETSPAKKDGDEAGGAPVWYPNNDNPTWKPNGNIEDNQPFIFGYIADPKPTSGTMDKDRKVYHEFSIYLYKEGMRAPRQMTYRLYMILDTEQMMYPRESAPRHPHVH